MMQGLDLKRRNTDIRRMTGTYNLSGPNSVIRSLIRVLIIGAATIGGLFIVAASAAFAFFLAIGLFLLGALTYAFFWLRAKISGRPMGPQIKFNYRANVKPFSADDAQDGPVIDAHKTSDGWSVDR